jgi:hypothetical protein
LSFRASFPTTNTTYTVRIDQNFGTYDKIFASYDTRENTLLTGGSPAFPAPIDPNTWLQDFVTHYGRLGWDHTLNPSMLNHLNLGFSRFNSNNRTPAAFEGVDWPAKLGIANVNGPAFPQFNINSGFPSQARHPQGAAVEIEAGLFVFRPHAAGAQTELEATIAQNIDRCRLPRQQHRMAEIVVQDVGADPQARARRGGAYERRKWRQKIGQVIRHSKNLITKLFDLKGLFRPFGG